MANMKNTAARYIIETARNTYYLSGSSEENAIKNTGERKPTIISINEENF